MPRLRPPPGYLTIPEWSRQLDRGITPCRRQIAEERIPEENLMRTTTRQKNRATGAFKLNPVTYIKDGTPYPEREWGGKRQGAGRKKGT